MLLRKFTQIYNNLPTLQKTTLAVMGEGVAKTKSRKVLINQTK